MPPDGLAPPPDKPPDPDCVSCTPAPAPGPRPVLAAGPERAPKPPPPAAEGYTPDAPVFGGNPLNAATAPPPDEDIEMPPPGEIWLDALSRLPAEPRPVSMSLSRVTICFELP